MEITFKPTDRGWCRPSKGAKHTDRSLKVFRTFFRDGLRYIRLPNGRILTKYEWIDAYLEQFEVKDDKAKRTAIELMEGLR